MDTLAFGQLLKILGPAGLIIISLISAIVWLKFKMRKMCEDILDLEKKMKECRDSTVITFKDYTRTAEIDLKFTSLQEVLAAKLDAMLTEIRAIKTRVNGN